jgi:hypothetical protein
MVHLDDGPRLEGLHWKLNVVIFLGLCVRLVVYVDKALNLQRVLSQDCLSESFLWFVNPLQVRVKILYALKAFVKSDSQI